jgi:hypothetical protein
MQPYSAPLPLVTGWIGQEGSVWKADPHRQFHAILEDNFYPESTVECGYLTYGDGWWINAWRRFLFNMRGRSDDFISDDFKLYDFGPRPPGCNGYMLPLGVATAARVAPNPEQTFLSALAELNDMDHSILFNDPYGVAGIMPYDYVSQGLTPFRGYFNYSESGDPDSADFLTSMWRSRQIQVSTADRRNSVAFFGPDPNKGRSQGTFLNMDDFFPGWTAAIDGFRRPLTKVSAYFIDPEFTAAWAEKALTKVTLPSVWEWVGGAYLPGLYCMDRIAINDTATDLSGTVFLAADDIRQRWDLHDTSVFGSTIRGRWLSNL